MSDAALRVWTLLAWLVVAALLLGCTAGIYKIGQQRTPRAFPAAMAFVLISALFFLPKCSCLDVRDRLQGDIAAFAAYASLVLVVVAATRYFRGRLRLNRERRSAAADLTG